jgi:hypothetical protein
MEGRPRGRVDASCAPLPHHGFITLRRGDPRQASATDSCLRADRVRVKPIDQASVTALFIFEDREWSPQERDRDYLDTSLSVGIEK